MPTPNDFSNVQLSGTNPGSGEFGQVTAGYNGPDPSTDQVPCPIPSKQFSSDKTGDPKELLQQTAQGVRDHGELVSAYGYKMPVATLGSHAWLRDELADVSELEPGNAIPKPGLKIPFKGGQ